MKEIFSIVGARPNFMKVAPLHRALQLYAGSLRHYLVHTGQHYDRAMSKVFFEDLGLPEPDFYLGIGSGSHAEQTGKIMMAYEKVLDEHRPDMVVVVGDVNSTMACSLVSTKMGVPVAHVEAGLRSFDRSMPEEINRLLTDAIADLLFVSEPSGVVNLKREGIAEEKIFHVGNIMIDSLVHYRPQAEKSAVLQDLDLAPRRYVLVTLHRPSNVDEPASLRRIFEGLRVIAEQVPVVFPVHPRTRKMVEKSDWKQFTTSTSRLRISEPFGYLDFLKLMMNASVVITDSGGIQEETTYLGIPCLTLRENTERPITVDIGTNEICGSRMEVVVDRAREILSGKLKKGAVPDFWDGRTAERIAQHINRAMK